MTSRERWTHDLTCQPGLIAIAAMVFLAFSTAAQVESVVAGPATNVQFMVKDSNKYASTGGWGFAQFNDGKPARRGRAQDVCFDCHAPAKDREFVFTRYAH